MYLQTNRYTTRSEAKQNTQYTVILYSQQHSTIHFFFYSCALFRIFNKYHDTSCKESVKCYSCHLGNFKPLLSMYLCNYQLITELSLTFCGHYLIIVPLQDKSAESVISAYTTSVYSWFGSLRFLLSDNGKEFKNHLFQEVCRKLCIQHKFSNVYYPKGNSRIKNVHNFLKQSISKNCDIYLNLEWDVAIHLACYAFNISETCDNMNSPFFINHGWHPLDTQL